ncbi:MAG: Uncharacterised protein [Flavobacterium sp. SCGC AAA160-P02]|nr:MAG: Uncharacterised protein [Flavobacterium sp. SCGC AAA160-P02]
MKKYHSLISLFILILATLWGFYDLQPTFIKPAKNKTDFSINNALTHLKEISKEPHYVGTEAHKTVQKYIISELQKLGLNPTIQTQTILNSKWRITGTTVENIIVKINGTRKGKALLLLTHYDSSPHSAPGASDAGSGVVTILEGIRAFLAENQAHKNDIIILISDAEELGLLGAKAFVEHHPLAKNIGLVLNFEARGSGGPSFMLMETNGKNSKMISEFLNANPSYPASNSLLYSIYKRLPNDTDLTVFRENADINGFNFAFIDDHFDYHTAQDTYERLDRTALAHQGDYLMNGLNYFSNSDIEHLNSDEDFIYVNFPLIKMLSYPFSWNYPLFIFALFMFLILIWMGVILNKIQIRNVLIGFIPSMMTLLFCGGSSYLIWKFIVTIQPSYKDMLHGFTYNGYWFIGAFVFLSCWMFFFIYRKFTTKDNLISLSIAPIFLWLVISFLIQEDFKGAGFIIIPVIIAELILTISIFLNPSDKNYSILFSLLSIPTVYIFAPLVKLFPVGLGLKIVFISSLLVALILGLLLPVLNVTKARNGFLKLSGVLTISCFLMATFFSGFTIDKKKPNSLVYFQNIEDSASFWGTYNTVLDDFVSQKIKKTSSSKSIKNAETKSKYNTLFTHAVKAENKPVGISNIIKKQDTIINDERILEFIISPSRKINKYELRLEKSVDFNYLQVNNVDVNDGNSFSIKKGPFLIYHMGNSDQELRIVMSISNEISPVFYLNEISYDLLNNPLFEIEPRTDIMMPMPFVTNDAIITTQIIRL